MSDVEVEEYIAPVWMVEQPPHRGGRKPRQEEAPMWRDAILAWNTFRDAVNDLLDLEDDAHGGSRRTRRR